MLLPTFVVLTFSKYIKNLHKQRAHNLFEAPSSQNYMWMAWRVLCWKCLHSKCYSARMQEHVARLSNKSRLRARNKSGFNDRDVRVQSRAYNGIDKIQIVRVFCENI